MYTLLPDSYRVKSDLTKSQRPAAPGGFSDVWKAEGENGEVFAIKALRMYEKNVALVRKVRRASPTPSLLRKTF